MVALLLVGGVSIAQAHDFVATYQGQKLYYNVLDATAKTAEVTYKGSITDQVESAYAGEITIPASVTYKNTTYSVKAIGKKAFANADKLTGITLPSGLAKVDAFAFEGCTGLTKVIFPGNPVTLGQGTFFRCSAIEDVTLGSDWTEVNLMMFRWSEKLTHVTIPAKVTTLKNMKALKALIDIDVDKNNSHFTSTDGLLYTKDGSTLLGCPRGRIGQVRIPEGVEQIKAGALQDCPGLTRIDLPSTLVSLSFREFYRLEALSQLILRTEAPLITAKQGGNQYSVLMLASQDVEVIVPKAALKAYKTALQVKPGEYAEIGANIPYRVEAHQLPSPKKIIGVKQFTKYE